jgi:hypothetical protein
VYPSEGRRRWKARYGLVELEGKWETLAEDRAPVPEDFFKAEVNKTEAGSTPS